jgi:hypothetical protein
VPGVRVLRYFPRMRRSEAHASKFAVILVFIAAGACALRSNGLGEAPSDGGGAASPNAAGGESNAFSGVNRATPDGSASAAVNSGAVQNPSAAGSGGVAQADGSTPVPSGTPASGGAAYGWDSGAFNVDASGWSGWDGAWGNSSYYDGSWPGAWGAYDASGWYSWDGDWGGG